MLLGAHESSKHFNENKKSLYTVLEDITLIRKKKNPDVTVVKQLNFTNSIVSTDTIVIYNYWWNCNKNLSRN